MPGGKSKGSAQRTPQKTRNSRGKWKKDDRLNDGDGNLDLTEKVTKCNPGVEHNISMPKQSKSTKVVLQEGDAIMDMQATESDDEFFSEEDHLVEQSDMFHSKQPGKESEKSANNNASVMPDRSQVTQVCTDNPAQVTQAASSQMNENVNMPVSENDTMFEHIATNEKFMQSFAQFMVQKGYLYKRNGSETLADHCDTRSTGVDHEEYRMNQGHPDHNQTGMKRGHGRDEGANHTEEVQETHPRSNQGNFGNNLESPSEITIYKRAVLIDENAMETEDSVMNKRDSSSSEELVNISDE